LLQEETEDGILGSAVDGASRTDDAGAEAAGTGEVGTFGRELVRVADEAFADGFGKGVVPEELARRTDGLIEVLLGKDLHVTAGLALPGREKKVDGVLADAGARGGDEDICASRASGGYRVGGAIDVDDGAAVVDERMALGGTDDGGDVEDREG